MTLGNAEGAVYSILLRRRLHFWADFPDWFPVACLAVQHGDEQRSAYDNEAKCCHFLTI
jgi:hypothetical protein